VECGDHYARSMASYGVFIAACGYEHHGPQGHLGFAPRLTPENFKAAFTTAEGWGTYEQSIRNGALVASVQVRWGRLRLKTLSLALPARTDVKNATVTANGRPLAATVAAAAGRAVITLGTEAIVKAGQLVEVRVGG